MLLVKVPVPVPSVVLLLEIVGLADVPQHTPLAVIEAPPSAVTLPPLVAVVEVTEDTSVVVTVGVVVEVVNVRSLPYVVPTLFVAYALT